MSTDFTLYIYTGRARWLKRAPTGKEKDKEEKKKQQRIGTSLPSLPSPFPPSLPPLPSLLSTNPSSL